MKENERASAPELPDYEHEPISPAPLPGEGFFSAVNRRRLLRIAFLIVLILLTPSIYRAVKDLRARSLVAQSSEACAFGDPVRGLQLMKQALNLSPGSLLVIHAAELYNARAGDKAALETITARMHAGGSDRDELLGIAEMMIQRNQAKEASEALALLPASSLSATQSLRRSLAEAEILAVNGEIDGAASLCLRHGDSHRGSYQGRLRTQAALYFLRLGQEARAREAVGILTDVVQQRSDASLPAWRILARLALESQGESPLFTRQETSRLAVLFDGLRGATSSDRLLCADLRIAADPSANEVVVTSLEKERKGAPRNEMLEYARWLNMHRMPRRVIDFAGENLPREDTDWLLIILDARSALGEWKGIPELIDSPAGQGIPDAVKHLYLARAATLNGHRDRAEEEWRRVGGLLHLEKPETLAYIAGYEEKIGAYDRAARTYRELADRKETAALGLIGVIRCQPRAASAGKLIPLYEELLKVAPGQPEAEGDLVYLRLLLGVDVVQSEETARRLLEARPDSLARISTAALGRLRLGDPKGALRLYEGKSIDWQAAPEPWRAVRVAVLNANGDAVAASRLADTIPADRLRPEEVLLFKGDKVRK